MKVMINKWLRYLCISIILLLIIPLCERDRIVSGAVDKNHFEGKELTCVIDLGDDMRGAHGLETGFSYELMKRFAEDNNCSISMIVHNNGQNFKDSLKTGKIDLLITHNNQLTDSESIRLSQPLDECTVIAMSGEENFAKINEINSWINYIKISGEFDSIKSRFKGVGNPIKRAEKGIIARHISPYDKLIKKYAAELGWDWRMLAAVVYQESKFSINSKSHRGAQGLMQVMPSTAARYHITDLVEPENNLKAGTQHLKLLQNNWRKRNLEPSEMIRFTLASYNAGEGKILECRNFVKEKGQNADKWNEIVNLIPEMREQGLFQGYETIAYINNILSLYDAICKIYPRS